MRRSYLTMPEVAIILLIVATWLGIFVLPHFSRPSYPHARAVNCAGNLKQTGLALLMYSGDYDGYFPAAHANGTTNFEPLVKEYYIQNGKVWACPSRSQVLTLASNSAYVYIGSGLMDDNDNATNVSLAYDQYDNHPDNYWMNTLFIDGHVQGARPGSKPWAHNEVTP